MAKDQRDRQEAQVVLNRHATNDVAAGYVVILTACIDPAQGSVKTVKIVRNDPLVRLEDYKNGLRFWLELDDLRLDRIVFIENSGYPLDTLKKIALDSNPFNKQVEFISLCCNDYPPGLHYGYAELDMLDRAFECSELWKQSKYWIKATGRLTFPGLPQLLNRLPSEYQFAVDCRDSSFLRRSHHAFVTTQLMIFSTQFYQENLFDIKSKLTPDVSKIEALLYRELIRLKGQDGAILRWAVSVDPVGQAAHWVKDYRAPRSRLINAARAMCRVLFPTWWV